MPPRQVDTRPHRRALSSLAKLAEYFPQAPIIKIEATSKEKPGRHRAGLFQLRSKSPEINDAVATLVFSGSGV